MSSIETKVFYKSILLGCPASSNCCVLRRAVVERSPAERLLGADLGGVDWQQKLAPLQQEGRGAPGGQGVAQVRQVPV